MIKAFLTLLAIFLLSYGAFASWHEPDIRPNAMQFAGTIGGKYSIQMRLVRALGTDVDAPLAQPCEDISGTYWYTSKLLPITVDGRFCLEGQRITLAGWKADFGPDESFEGRWDAQSKSIRGSWRSEPEADALSFELHAVGLDVSPLQGQRLLEFLLAQFLKNEFSFDPSLDGADWDARGGSLRGFQVGRGGIEAFTRSSLKIFADNSSTAYSSGETYTVQLLPHPNETFILYVNESYYCETPFPMSDEEEDDWDEVDRCQFGSDVRLYHWTVNGFQMVTDSLFPKGFPPKMEGQSMGTSVEVLYDRLSITTGGATGKWKWEGGRFVAY